MQEESREDGLQADSSSLRQFTLSPTFPWPVILHKPKPKPDQYVDVSILKNPKVLPDWCCKECWVGGGGMCIAVQSCEQSVSSFFI